MKLLLDVSVAWSITSELMVRVLDLFKYTTVNLVTKKNVAHDRNKMIKRYHFMFINKNIQGLYNYI